MFCIKKGMTHETNEICAICGGESEYWLFFSGLKGKPMVCHRCVAEKLGLNIQEK